MVLCPLRGSDAQIPPPQSPTIVAEKDDSRWAMRSMWAEAPTGIEITLSRLPG